jgi:CubicO group peptidase (beta-lactamase class C family)
MGAAYGETPIRHLLTMSSGVRFSEANGGADELSPLVRLSVPKESNGGGATVMPFDTRERAPGEPFGCSSADTQVVGLA